MGWQEGLAVRARGAAGGEPGRVIAAAGGGGGGGDSDTEQTLNSGSLVGGALSMARIDAWKAHRDGMAGQDR